MFLKNIRKPTGVSCILHDFLFRVQHVRDVQGYILIVFFSTACSELKMWNMWLLMVPCQKKAINSNVLVSFLCLWRFKEIIKHPCPRISASLLLSVSGYFVDFFKISGNSQEQSREKDNSLADRHCRHLNRTNFVAIEHVINFVTTQNVIHCVATTYMTNFGAN